MERLNAIETLARVIAYPEKVPAGTADFTFVIDGRAVRVRTAGGRLVVSCVLADGADGASLSRFAGIAPGRMMADEAAPAWDAEARALALWQELGQGSGDEMVKRLEDFLNALDWWMARVDSGGAMVGAPSEFIIRP